MQKKQAAALSAAVVGLVSSSACAQTALEQESVQTRVIFSNPPGAPMTEAEFADAFLWSGLTKFKTPQLDGRLQSECLAPAGNKAGAGAVLGFLVGPLVSIASDAIKKKLAGELEKYTVEVKAAGEAPFYKTENNEQVQAWRCFRVTRIRSTTLADNSIKRTVDFDFLGQVGVVGSQDRIMSSGADFREGHGVKVRPLRVYMGRPVAKGSMVNVAGSVTFDVVWREGDIGKQATLFQTAAVEHKFIRSAGKTWAQEPYYFPDVDEDGAKDPDKFPAWSGLPIMPYIPVSHPGQTYVRLTYKGAEAGDGDGKAILKVLGGVFKAAQSDLNDVVTKAAVGVVNPDKPEPPASPEMFCGTFQKEDAGGGAFSWTKAPGSTCATSDAPT